MRISSCAGEFVCQLALTLSLSSLRFCPPAWKEEMPSSWRNSWRRGVLLSDIIRVPQVFLDVCVFPLVNRSILMPFEMPWKTLAPEIKSAQVLRNDVLSTARGAFTYPKHLIMRNLTQTCISLFSITLRILFTNNSYLRTFVYICSKKKLTTFAWTIEGTQSRYGYLRSYEIPSFAIHSNIKIVCMEIALSWGMGF